MVIVFYLGNTILYEATIIFAASSSSSSFLNVIIILIDQLYDSGIGDAIED